MFKVVKIKPTKLESFTVDLDNFLLLKPSQRISVGVVKDRTDVYYKELVEKMSDTESLKLLKYLFIASHNKGVMAIESRVGDWVCEGFMRFIKDHQQAFYMALNLPLTDKEKQISNLTFA